MLPGTQAGEGPVATLTPFVLCHYSVQGQEINSITTKIGLFVLFSIVFLFFVLEDRFSQYSPGTCSVDQPGIKGVVTVTDLTKFLL